ncbi:MAG: putative lipoprotein YmbA [Paraglaciecola sp.]|jgi:uncharacterized lipoprotein YmbA
MKYISVMFISFLLFACASPMSTIQYYMLNTADDDAPIANINQQDAIVLAPVQLANYLNKINLVMKIAKNQLYYSEQDVWAESLQTGIYNALLKDLNSQTVQSHYIAMNSPNAKQSNKRLIVEFSHFMPTDQSQVIASGQYWLIDTSDLNNTAPIHNFSYAIPLHQDGYAHAVTQLNALLGILSLDIIKQVESEQG